MVNNFLHQNCSVTEARARVISDTSSIAILKPFHIYNDFTVIISCDFNVLMEHISMNSDKMHEYCELRNNRIKYEPLSVIEIDSIMFINYHNELCQWEIQAKRLSDLLPICKSDELFKIVSFDMG